MKRTNFLKIAGIFVISICYSCTTPEKKHFSLDNCNIIAEKTSNGKDSLLTCNLQSVKDTFIVPLSMLLSDLEIVKLEDSEDALIKFDGNATVSNNYIGIFSSSSGGYKVYNKQGKYLRTLSSKGNGPNEYLIAIYDSYIDEKHQKFYLLPMTSNYILVYDFEGKPLDPIPLAYKIHKGRFRIDYEKKEVLLAVLPFPDTPSAIWKQDFDGNIIQEVPSGNLTIPYADYSNEINSSFNTKNIDYSIFLWEPKADTLYHYIEAENRLKPALTLKFNDEIEQHDYMELPNHYLIALMEPRKISPFISITDYKPFILLDKKTLKGAYIKLEVDILGGIEGAEWLIFNRGYYYANMYPHEIKEQLSQVLKNAGKISEEAYENARKLHDAIDDDGNNILLIGKLKENAMENFTLKTFDIQPAENTTSTKRVQDTQKDDLTDSADNDDDKIYGFDELKSIKNTPQLENYKQYFRTNNKYNTWDSDNKKEVLVGYIVEKNGKPSGVFVKTSCGIQELDDEAVRLINEAHFLPGINFKDEPIRCGDMMIPVHFPPQ